MCTLNIGDFSFVADMLDCLAIGVSQTRSAIGVLVDTTVGSASNPSSSSPQPQPRSQCQRNIWILNNELEI
ncbi:hypothetical protein ACKLNR_005877 [Fusarium oxysporum f. sp. zingiberi]